MTVHSPYLSYRGTLTSHGCPDLQFSLKGMSPDHMPFKPSNLILSTILQFVLNSTDGWVLLPRAIRYCPSPSGPEVSSAAGKMRHSKCSARRFERTNWPDRVTCVISENVLKTFLNTDCAFKWPYLTINPTNAYKCLYAFVAIIFIAYSNIILF